MEMHGVGLVVTDLAIFTPVGSSFTITTLVTINSNFKEGIAP